MTGCVEISVMEVQPWPQAFFCHLEDWALNRHNRPKMLQKRNSAVELVCRQPFSHSWIRNENWANPPSCRPIVVVNICRLTQHVGADFVILISRDFCTVRYLHKCGVSWSPCSHVPVNPPVRAMPSFADMGIVQSIRRTGLRLYGRMSRARPAAIHTYLENRERVRSWYSKMGKRTAPSLHTSVSRSSLVTSKQQAQKGAALFS